MVQYVRRACVRTSLPQLAFVRSLIQARVKRFEALLHLSNDCAVHLSTASSFLIFSIPAGSYSLSSHLYTPRGYIYVECCDYAHGRMFVLSIFAVGQGQHLGQQCACSMFTTLQNGISSHPTMQCLLLKKSLRRRQTGATRHNVDHITLQYNVWALIFTLLIEYLWLVRTASFFLKLIEEVSEM